MGFDKERYEDRETATGHPSKGEKAEGRKSGIGLEMAEEESLVYIRGKEEKNDGRNEAGIIRLPEPEVRLCSRTKFGQSPSR